MVAMSLLTAAVIPFAPETWQDARNASGKGVDWQFTADGARIKLKRLYPQF